MISDEEKVHQFIFPESFEKIKAGLEKITDNRYLGMLRPDVELFCFEMFSKQEFIGDNLHKLIGTIQKYDYEKIIFFLYENSEKGFSEEKFQDVCGITFDPDWKFELP